MGIVVWLRLGVRFVALLLWTMGVYVLWTPFLVWGWVSKRRLIVRRTYFLRWWGRGMLRILGGRLEVRGMPPERPFLLVCNHLGYVDIFAIAGVTGSLFVSRAEVAHWPVMGPVMRGSQAIFIKREESSDAVRVVAELADALGMGEGVSVFPEARCSPGKTVLPFKPALFEAAVIRGVPVWCASIRYEAPPGFPPASENVVWWREETLATHLLRLLKLPRFRATLSFAPVPLHGDNRKELAVRAHETVLGLFVPVAQPETEA